MCTYTLYSSGVQYGDIFNLEYWIISSFRQSTNFLSRFSPFLLSSTRVCFCILVNFFTSAAYTSIGSLGFCLLLQNLASMRLFSFYFSVSVVRLNNLFVVGFNIISELLNDKLSCPVLHSG